MKIECFTHFEIQRMHEVKNQIYPLFSLRCLKINEEAFNAIASLNLGLICDGRYNCFWLLMFRCWIASSYISLVSMFYYIDYGR